MQGNAQYLARKAESKRYIPEPHRPAWNGFLLLTSNRFDSPRSGLTVHSTAILWGVSNFRATS